MSAAQPETQVAYENRYWWSKDGLRLHYRDYPGRDDRPPIVCLSGLTRNARDWDTLAPRLSGDWRVLAVDLRGRGESAYAKDPMSYVPLTYVQDIEALLDDAGIGQCVVFGTSLGGIVAMLLAAADRGRLAGALINDVGPEIEAAGMSRIRTYVGKANSWPTWMHAARAVAEQNGEFFPGYAIHDWLAMAKRLYRVNAAGRIVLDYDMRIAEPFRVPGNEAGPDMWRALAALADIPTLIVRGARSDLLSAATASRMALVLERGELVTVADRGHAPTLDEPDAIAGIDRLLAQVAQS